MFGYAIVAYLVGVAVLAILPGWRSLVVGAVLATGFVVWVWNDIHTHGNGLAFALAVFLLLVLSLGLISGFLGRALILIGGPRGWKLARPGFALPLAMFAAIGFVVANNAITRFMKSPPSQACLERRHSAALADIPLKLPLTPVMAVGQGWEFEPTYLFNINRDARQFCALGMFWTPTLTKLSIDINPGRWRRDSGFCSRQQLEPWLEVGCRRTSEQVSTIHPLRMTVYAPGAYNAKKMHGGISAENQERYRERLAALQQVSLAGGVTRYDDERYIFFLRESPEGYLARCHQLSAPAKNGELTCQAGYPLSDTVGLVYSFHVDAENFAEQSERIDRGAREIFDDLKAEKKSP